MTTTDDIRAAVQFGVEVGKLHARIEALVVERNRAIAVIRKAESMVNGFADNDYEIAVTVLRPFLESIAS